MLSDDQYSFIFPLNCGQQPDIVIPIEIDLFGRLERLEWMTKQSSDRPTNNIRHVKYFAQKPRRPINSSVTLDVQGSILVVWSPKNILLAHCTVISESPLPTKYKIKCLVVRQNGANIHWSVPTSLLDPTINLYTSVVDFI